MSPTTFTARPPTDTASRLPVAMSGGSRILQGMGIEKEEK